MRSIMLLVATVFVLSFVATAQAREWRGCSGSLKIWAPYKTTVTIARFEGRGSCRSRVYANDCRRAARGAIQYCVSELWRTRWDRVVPYACREAASGTRPFVAGLYNTSFGRGPGAQGVQDVKWAIERAACCQMFPSTRNVSVSVGASSSGDKGCQSSMPEWADWQLESNYRVDCRTFRQRGYCG
jgi:hypothetical protein